MQSKEVIIDVDVFAFKYVCGFVFITVIIPKAKEIEAARRQRRAARAQREFISLDKDGRSSSGSSPEHLSREDEEDQDDDNELDDFEKRIEFAPRQKSIRERIAEKLGKSLGTLGQKKKM